MKRVLIAVLLLGSVMGFGQPKGAQQVPFNERLDAWYGADIFELKKQLEDDKEEMEFKEFQTGKRSVIMWDYRDVKVTYTAMDGRNISYRIDKYTKSQYKGRKLEITNEWRYHKGYYILRSSVVAILNDKTREVLFIPAQYFGDLELSTDTSPNENFSMLIL